MPKSRSGSNQGSWCRLRESGNRRDIAAFVATNTNSPAGRECPWVRAYDRLLLILSEPSMKSEWVKTEIAKARKRELREQRRMLFPVSLVGFDAVRDWECFDADTGKDSAREIREYFIPDFSEWKNHDRYQTGFERLLKDLKAVEK